MLNQAFIIRINGSKIYAMQLVTAACMGCTTGCIQRGKPFLVTNKRKLPIKKGCIVRIGMSSIKHGIHAIASLFIPVICAILGYVSAPVLAKKIGLESTESFKAICVAGCMAVSAGIVFAISRSSIHFSKPEILQIMQN
ncbi:MAG: SoxR reducing system RseC family protein [Treponema sp.]|nr:SoxR reducing system RseC family protein [Treponema sp.]